MIRKIHGQDARESVHGAFREGIGAFADLARVHQWNQEFAATSGEGRRYEAFARSGHVPAGAAVEVVGIDTFRVIVTVSTNPSKKS